MIENIEQIKKDYKLYEPHFQEFQDEVLNFLKEFRDSEEETFGIKQVRPRFEGKIKELSSILDNIKVGRDKYKKKSCLLDIKDISGVAIVCYSQIDRDRLCNVLENKLASRGYLEINPQSHDDMYKAKHLNFAKEIIGVNKQKKRIYCEIQLLTILSDAWKVLDGKYRYKKEEDEGEPKILSNAISDILNSCESLWDLIKAKNQEYGKELQVQDMKKVQDEAEKQFEAANKVLVKPTEDTKEWFDRNHIHALSTLEYFSISSYMEVMTYVPDLSLEVGRGDLKDAAKKSAVHFFGWPIAVYLEKEEHKPKVKEDGIAAEIKVNRRSPDGKDKGKMSYDYWRIRKNGSFHLIKSLFEDLRKPECIFFNTRIIRITETLMYVRNFYGELGIGRDKKIRITIRHGGLKGKTIKAVGNRDIFGDYKSDEDEEVTEIETNLNELEDKIVDLVERFTIPLFEIFDFFKIERHIIEDIVLQYEQEGKVT